jgi:hypothetical protein
MDLQFSFFSQQTAALITYLSYHIIYTSSRAVSGPPVAALARSYREYIDSSPIKSFGDLREKYGMIAAAPCSLSLVAVTDSTTRSTGNIVRTGPTSEPNL